MWLSGKESFCQGRDANTIPGSERSHGGGNGNPLQYSCLGNPVDRGAWWAIVHGVTKSQTWLSDSTTTNTPVIEYCYSGAQSCLTLFDSMDCSLLGFAVLYYLLEFAQTHVYWVGDAIQSSHLLSPPSPLALNLSQHQGLFQWVSSSYQVAKVLELQLQHQSYQWIFRVDFL